MNCNKSFEHTKWSGKPHIIYTCSKLFSPKYQSQMIEDKQNERLSMKGLLICSLVNRLKTEKNPHLGYNAPKSKTGVKYSNLVKSSVYESFVGSVQTTNSTGDYDN